MTSNDLPGAATALFGFRNGDGVLVSEAGVPASTLFRSGRIFVDQVGTRTALAMVNPGLGSASLTLVLRDEAGSVVAEGNLTLTGGQHQSRFVDELFSVSLDGFRGTMTVDSDQPIA